MTIKKRARKYDLFSFVVGEVKRVRRVGANVNSIRSCVSEYGARHGVLFSVAVQKNGDVLVMRVK